MDSPFRKYLDLLEPCTYCGLLCDTKDHIPPLFIRKRLRELELEAAIVKTVPACRECNSALSARYLLTIGTRREFIKGWLIQRYSHILRIPKWTDDELKELSRELAGYVRNNLRLKELILARLRWPKRGSASNADNLLCHEDDGNDSVPTIADLTTGKAGIHGYGNHEVN